VLVIALDRWGRVLLVRDAGEGREGAVWRIPGGSALPLEPPDEAAVRCFDEVTGCFLERLQLFRVYRQAEREAAIGGMRLHVYFDDPDLDLEGLALERGKSAAYVEPTRPDGRKILEEHRAVIEQFGVSNSYRALFH